MNNMFEYLTGGQCYKCGGKVRYPDGGENMQPSMQQQSPVANMGATQQPRQPSTIDASAKELMTFLLNQLSKGTSERILKKTLVDSGLKSEQATELLAIAKQEFDKTISEGDYSTSDEERQMQMQAQQSQMNMMNQAGPNAGMDQSMMAMNQQNDQSNMADTEMQARFGGSMRRLRRMNMGGSSCPDGFIWSDAAGNCVPTATTANTMQAGAGPVNMGMSPMQTQQSTKQTTDSYNQNMMQNADLQDKQRNAQAAFYDKMLNANRTKRQQGFDNSLNAMGAIHQQMMEGKLPWQAPAGTPAVPSVNPVQEMGRVAQDANTQSQMATQRFGGLAKFVGGGQSCPEGQYWNGTACVDVFQKDPRVSVPSAPMNAPQANNVDAVLGDQSNLVKGVDASSSAIFGNSPNAPMGPAATNTFDPNAKSNAAQNNTNKDGAPIDPRLTNSPYIVRTDKNKIANLDNNWVNRALAVGSNLGSAQTLGATGAFGPYLQMLLGATGAISSAALGAKKLFAGNDYTVYDDKGNVFQYGNKRSFKNAGRDSESSNSGVIDSHRNDDIPKDSFMKTGEDKYGRPVGIGSEGELVSQQNPMRGIMRNTGQVDEFGQPIKEPYSDSQRLDDALELAGKTRKDFRQQGPALFGENMYGSKQELADDYNEAGFFGKMRQRNQFKKDQLWETPLSSDEMKNRMNPAKPVIPSGPSNTELERQIWNEVGTQRGLPGLGDVEGGPNTEKVVSFNSGSLMNSPTAIMQSMMNQNAPDMPYKQEGGEWNPFVDNRRKLRISMPMYAGGGPINGETTPYTQQEWAQVQSKTFPLKPEDIQPYNDYVANFNNSTAQNNTGTQTNLTTPQVNMTNNANNALSANPNANMVDTKEYTIERGDALGSRVAQNLYSGLAGWNAGLNEIQGRKAVKRMEKQRQQLGNSMEFAAVNPINMYGSWQVNANQGSNYDLANQGATQDWQTTLNAKYGGPIYRKGGTYMISPQELQAIIAMGGEVEFLD